MSLFELVTGTGRAAVEKVTGSQRVDTPKTLDDEPKAQRQMPAAEPAMPRVVVGQATAQTAPQPTLGGLDPDDRPVESAEDDDLLDIPAFLRRQAN